MLYRTFTKLALGLLAFSVSVAAQTTTQAKLTVTNAVISDTNIPPNLMQVSWDLTGLRDGDRVEKYQLTLELSANGQQGKVVQTPSPNLKTVSVGLLGIPTDVRTKIFTGGQIVSAKITLAATIIRNGGRQTIFASLQKGFPTQSVNPRPKPTPSREQIRDGLKREKARVVERK